MALIDFLRAIGLGNLVMPIAKLISTDGPIEIYYELHGRHSTTRDDMSYSNAAAASSCAGKRSSSTKEAGQQDAALGRTLHAVDSAVGAQQAADRGRQEAESMGAVPSQSSASTAANGGPRRQVHSAAGSQIEMADMSGRGSSACLCQQDALQASEPQNLDDKRSDSFAGMVETALHVDKGAQNGDGSTAPPREESAQLGSQANGEHVIQMPHEDMDTSPSRYELHETSIFVTG